MMSDIDGVYKKPPKSEDDDNRVLYTFIPSDLEMVKFGGKSNVGTGGMESKVNFKWIDGVDQDYFQSFYQKDKQPSLTHL